MANEQIDVKGVAMIGKTPQGQVVAETPGSMPVSQHRTWGVWGNWLGDPDTRYGRRRSSRYVPLSVKLEMLNDPLIALCLGFMTAKLVNAEYEILCADEDKRRFFQAMYDAFHQEFMLQAAPAIALGSLGLIKKFRFETPRPSDPSAPPVWAGNTIPYICVGFDQIYPSGSSPTFDPKTKEFTGIDTSDGHVDVFYALWLTMGKARAFGGYLGHGRLEHAYADWWLKQFARDLYVVHLQKNIDRVVKMGYPPGTAADGKTHREHALDVGDDIRSGATVALPTTVYEVPDPNTGEMKPSNIAKWTAEFMEGSENVGAFHDMDDHLDQKIALGMFIPPQTFLNVRQSALGGPTTADVLGELAVDLLMLDAVDIDTHLNKYVFPVISQANFPPDSPLVIKRTTGLVEKDRAELMEVVKILAQRMDSEVPAVFDVQRALERLGMPIVERRQPAEPAEPAGNGGDTTGNTTPLALQGEEDDVPREVLERMVREHLPDDSDEAAMITDEDIQRVVDKLHEEIPELFDVETV